MSSFLCPEARQDVFELVLARPVCDAAGEHPVLVHLWWRAPMLGDRLVQVYVDGRLYDVTPDSETRQLWLVLDRTYGRRIELLAVPAGDPDTIWCPHPERLLGWQPQPRSGARVRLIRDERLNETSSVSLSLDGAASGVAELWPEDEPRAGTWSSGQLEYGEPFGLGLGLGELGAGALGYDGTAQRWDLNGLPAGQHVAVFAVQDAGGRALTDPLALPLWVERLPEPVNGLSIDLPTTLTWRAATPET